MNTENLMIAEEKEDVISRIENEGFDYCFVAYSDFDEVKDRIFHKLRQDYIDSRKKLSNYLGYKL